MDPKLPNFWIGLVVSPNTVLCGDYKCMAVRLVYERLGTVFVPLIADAVVNVLLGTGVHRVGKVAQDPQRRFWMQL